MNRFINLVLVAIAIVLGVCGAVSAAGPTPADIEKAKAAVAQMAEEIQKAEAEVARQAAAAEAARVKGLTWSTYAAEKGRGVVQTAKAAVCVTGAGVANLDGYTAGVVAVPARWVANKAFEGGSAAFEAAGSAWTAPVIAAPAAK